MRYEALTGQRSQNLGRLIVALQLAAFAAVLFGLKLQLIASFGSETPYWDQWDAEAKFFEKLRQGNLTWHQWLSPHNEHRIFTTRLLATALLYINGIWNPLLEMVINAGLHVLALTILVVLLGKSTGRVGLSALLLLTASVFSIPFAWENTIVGFQGQFYFVLIFSTLSIWWLVIETPFSPKWWIGIAMSVAAYFSFASGVFSVAAAAATVFLCHLTTGGKRSDYFALIFLCTLFLLYLAGVPKIPAHANLKAANFNQFLSAMLAGLSWPLNASWTWWLGDAFGSLLKNLPWIVLLIRSFQEKWKRTDPRWFILGAGIWVFGQILSIAYGRATDSLSSRYLDLFAIGLIINIAAMLALGWPTNQLKRGAYGVFAAGWLWCVAMAMMGWLHERTLSELAAKQNSSALQTKNLQRYLQTHDKNAMKALPFFHLPYPNADRLIEIFESTAFQSVLPRSLQSPILPIGVNQSDENTFQKWGVHPGLPDCRCQPWGSYGVQRDAGLGVLELHYPSMEREGWFKKKSMRMRVAGYPSRAGKIELIQDNKIQELRATADPGNDWSWIHFNVSDSPFTIRVVDESRTSWLALDAPSRQGSLDVWIDGILKNFTDERLNFFQRPVANEKRFPVSNAETCDGSMDSFDGHPLIPAALVDGTSHFLTGWLAKSAKDGLPAEKVYLVFSNRDGSRFLSPTRAVHRPDVAKHFNNSRLSETGYSVALDSSLLRGEYRLGLAYQDGQSLKICPQFNVPVIFGGK